jgi:hypothetical protein
MKTHERLCVRHFGPVQQAEIAPRNLTVFVGPQASGKSLVAQLLFFMQWMEVDEQTGWVQQALEDWLGASLLTYARANTLVQWSPAHGEDVQEIYWKDSTINTNQALNERVLGLQLVPPPTVPGEHIYIPAGRGLYSYVPPHSLLRMKRQWPGFILLFYNELGAAIEKLEKQAFQHVSPATLSPPMTLVEQRMQAVLKGRIRYGKETIMLDIGNILLSSHNLAAGQMEIWPFFAIVQDGFLSRQSLKYLVFEEPEAHLHPGAQRMVMEIIAVLVNYGVQVVLTTHSPYILYALNNFLMAHKVQYAGRSLESIVQQQTMLRPEQVVAYRFTDDGVVHSLLDAEVGLIDADELEQVAEDLGAEFSNLQDLLSDDEEWRANDDNRNLVDPPRSTPY